LEDSPQSLRLYSYRSIIRLILINDDQGETAVKPKGLLTPQRKAIYDVICASPDHPTAAEIMDRLRERGSQFAYGTVYNTLKYLTETGQIQELRVGEACRYDARTERHHHIQCSVCGRVDEVFADIPEQWVQEVALETGYLVNQEQLLLKGVCASCRAPRN
jgi:Fur family transcriptional regulator, peroxide stress response regulator